MRAYVFIQTEPGGTDRLTSALRRLDRVSEPSFLAGPYDVVLEIRAANVHDLEQRVEHDIDPLPGVHRTQTFAVIDAPFSARRARASRSRSRAGR